MKFVLSFESTHAALAVKKIFEKALEARMAPSAAIIPTPRQIDAGCGMALRFECETSEGALNLLFRLGIQDTDSRIYKEVREEKLMFLPLTPLNEDIAEHRKDGFPQDKISHGDDTA